MEALKHDDPINVGPNGIMLAGALKELWMGSQDAKDLGNGLGKHWDDFVAKYPDAAMACRRGSAQLWVETFGRFHVHPVPPAPGRTKWRLLVCKPARIYCCPKQVQEGEVASKRKAPDDGDAVRAKVSLCYEVPLVVILNLVCRLTDYLHLIQSFPKSVLCRRSRSRDLSPVMRLEDFRCDRDPLT